MLVALGASRTARDGEDSGNRRHRRDARFADALGFGERRAGRKRHHHIERILSERRQKARAEARGDINRISGRHERKKKYAFREPKRERKERAVHRAHDADAEGASGVFNLRRRLFGRAAAETKQPGKRRDDGPRADERHGKHANVGESKRTEEAPLKPREHQKRDKHQYDDKRREENARGDACGGIRYHRARMTPFSRRQGGILPELAPYHFREDDRRIHDVSGGDRESSKRHHVHAEIEHREEHKSQQNGYRHRAKHDENRAQLKERQEQYRNDDDHRVAQNFSPALDRSVDEVRLAVGVAMNLDSLRFDGLGKFGEHPVKFSGERGRIATRSLLHRKNDGFLTVERRAAAAGRTGDRHVRNVAEPERATVFKRYGRLSQGGQGVGARDLPQGNLFAADVRQIAGA